MRIVGYVYSSGAALCIKHATDLSDENNETGQAGPIWNTDETDHDLVCDVEGCGVILAANIEP